MSEIYKHLDAIVAEFKRMKASGTPQDTLVKYYKDASNYMANTLSKIV